MVSFGFRLKLMLAMLAVVGVITAVTLTVAVDRVEAANDRLFRGRVEAQLRYLPREQEARVGVLRQKAGEFAELSAVRDALEGRETARLYRLARLQFQRMLADEFRKLAEEMEAEEYEHARLKMVNDARAFFDRMAGQVAPKLAEPERRLADPTIKEPYIRGLPDVGAMYDRAMLQTRTGLAEQLRKISSGIGKVSELPAAKRKRLPAAAPRMMAARDPDGAGQAMKITASFLVFIGEQGEVLLPDARFGKFFDNPTRRLFRDRLEKVLPQLVALEEQAVGHLALGDEGGAGLVELVCTPVQQSGAGRKVGTLVLGFPISRRGEQALNDIGDLMTGMWVDGHLRSRAIAPEVLPPLVEWLKENVDGEQPTDRVDLIRLDGVPCRVFYAPMENAAGLPPAYKVGLYPWEEALAARADMKAQILMLGGVMGLGAMGLSWLISLGLFRPVRRLYRATMALRDGDYDVRIPVRSSDELGKLAQAFNETAEDLAQKNQYRDLLKKVADKEVAERLLNGQVALGGETHGMTVLFCDIRKYTELTQHMSPEETVAFLNEHMTAMTWVIHEHGGLVDKFVGDMIMAVFGATGSDPTAPERAVACARHMMQERRVLNMLRGQNINVGIGIATGKMLAGFIGSEDRLNFTVIGQGANLASRLCTVAGPMDILVDEVTCEAAAEGRSAEPLPPMEIKGFRDLQAVYRLTAEPTSQSEPAETPVSAK